MNGRIHEMMMEATKNMPQGYYVPGEYFQKFAELIVKDCLHIVDDEGAGEGGCIRAMIRIQEEFGVDA